MRVTKTAFAGANAVISTEKSYFQESDVLVSKLVRF